MRVLCVSVCVCVLCVRAQVHHRKSSQFDAADVYCCMYANDTRVCMYEYVKIRTFMQVCTKRVYACMHVCVSIYLHTLT